MKSISPSLSNAFNSLMTNEGDNTEDAKQSQGSQESLYDDKNVTVIENV